MFGRYIQQKRHRLDQSGTILPQPVGQWSSVSLLLITQVGYCTSVLVVECHGVIQQVQGLLRQLRVHLLPLLLRCRTVFLPGCPFRPCCRKAFPPCCLFPVSTGCASLPPQAVRPKASIMHRNTGRSRRWSKCFMAQPPSQNFPLRPLPPPPLSLLVPLALLFSILVRVSVVWEYRSYCCVRCSPPSVR